MTKLHDLAELGQSIWVDYVRRGFTRSGELQTIVDQGVRGVTSNPTIFEAAIARSDDYEPALQELLPRAASTRALYEALVMEDIREAADVLRPVYDQLRGEDGCVSLEVSPYLAMDAKGTIAEAEERGGDYFGPVVNTAARVEAAGHGGQVLMTAAVRSTARAEATDLGVHQLRDVDEPMHLFQFGEGEFPRLRVVDAALTNLPARPTRMIGRDDEVSRVRQLLAANRLVTITAVGLSLIHISEPTRLLSTSYAVFCLKKKNQLTHTADQFLAHTTLH